MKHTPPTFLLTIIISTIFSTFSGTTIGIFISIISQNNATLAHISTILATILSIIFIQKYTTNTFAKWLHATVLSVSFIFSTLTILSSIGIANKPENKGFSPAELQQLITPYLTSSFITSIIFSLLLTIYLKNKITTLNQKP